MMPSTHFMTKKQVVILLVLGVIGGFIIGSASTYIFLTQQQGQTVIALNLPSGDSSGLAPLSLPGDGVYLLDGGKSTQISQILKNQPVDINLAAATKDRKPSIAIQGNALPIGQLVLRGFNAGFGIDADFSNLGATVRTVFDGSPAQQAGIQPGDVIVKVDGERPFRPNVYTPGHVDIFGPMEPSVEVELVRGTTSSSVKMPRTYLHPGGPFEESIPPFAEKLSVTTKGSYVVLSPNEPLAPGAYRLEVPSKNITTVGIDFLGSSSTPTPSPVLDESTFYYWVFLVTR